jgi:hypothetical protein
MKKLLNTLLILFITVYSYSQNGIIRGFVYEKLNGEPIPFVKVKVFLNDSIKGGGVTDVNGFFSVPKLKIGLYTLKIDQYGFEPFSNEIQIQSTDAIEQTKIELVKVDKVKKLNEVVISASAKRKTTEVATSVVKLDKKALERIPSIGAENDIVGALSVTPGIVSTGDQGGQLYVRGGTPIQNKVLLDGMTIYSPFHSIGFFSVFETENIKNADVYTGGFDARYGGRISSIMDISYRDGNRRKFSTKLSASPFMGKIVLEGPLGKKNESGLSAGSYIFSTKQSFISQTSPTLYKNINNGDGMPFSFSDYYGKITLNAQDGSKLNVFGFQNTDQVNYNELANLTWNQKGGGMNFILIPGSSGVFIRGHVNGSSYDISFDEKNAKSRTSSISGGELGFDFSYFLKNESQLDAGISIGGNTTNYKTYNITNRLIEADNFTFELGAYLNYKLIIKKFILQPGIRIQNYSRLNVISPEPRLGIKYNLHEKFRLKFSGGRYSQNLTSASSDRDMVNLFNGILTAPDNVPSSITLENGSVQTIKNGIQYAWHGVAGTEIDLTKNLDLNVEVFYKYFPQISNINQYKMYTEDELNVEDIYKKDFAIETGKSYGFDVLLKYNLDRIYVWGAYSWSKSSRWDGFISYFPVFDRRHNVNVVTSIILDAKKTFEFNLRWNLGSGLPFTPTVGVYQNENLSGGLTTDVTTSNASDVSLILGEYNSRRLPYYHRLDITIKKNFKIKETQNLELIFAITNAYNRNNLFYINRVTNEKIYQFPFLPSLGMNYKF